MPQNAGNHCNKEAFATFFEALLIGVTKWIQFFSKWIPIVEILCKKNCSRNAAKKTGERYSLEAVVQRCSVGKVLIKISQKFTGKTGARVSFLIKLQAQCSFIKKDTLAQELCYIAKVLRTRFYRTPLVAASNSWWN